MSESMALALPDRWRKEAERYERDGWNVLVPKEIGEVPAFHIPHMSIVRVDPAKEAGETYPLPGGKFGLSKVILDKIAQAGSITWIPDACKSGWRTPRKYYYLAVGVVKGLDAVRRTIIGEKEIDLDVIEEELRQNLPKRWERMERKPPKISYEQWFRQTLAEESLQFKKHVAARCETGAKNRAIRSAYGLKSSYSDHEIRQPFVIPRMVPSFDMSDPEVKKMVLADALGIIPELYGKGPDAPLPLALPQAPDDEPILPGLPGMNDAGNNESGSAAPAIELPVQPAHRTDVPAAEQAPPPESRSAETPPPPDAILLFSEAHLQEAKAGSPEVKYAAIADQIAALKTLIALKGFQGRHAGEFGLAKPLAEFSRQQRQEFFEHLRGLPDKPAAQLWD